MIEQSCFYSCSRSADCTCSRDLNNNCMDRGRLASHDLLQMQDHKSNSCMWNSVCNNCTVLSDRTLQVPILACLPARTKRLVHRTDSQRNQNLKKEYGEFKRYPSTTAYLVNNKFLFSARLSSDVLYLVSLSLLFRYAHSQIIDDQQL